VWHLCPAGWLNFDASARLRLERMPLSRTLVRKTVAAIFPENVFRGGIVHGLPIRGSSEIAVCAIAVYSSRCLEHLPRGDLPGASTNTFRKQGARPSHN
jgi:hypothetical protein